MEPEFSQEEYESRVGRIQRSLAGSAIAGLLIVDEVNYRYVTGHYTEAWKNPSRRRGCWITPAGNPVVVGRPRRGWRCSGAQSGGKDVQYGGPSTGPLLVGNDPLLGFEADFASAIVDTGRELDWTASRISRWRWAAGRDWMSQWAYSPRFRRDLVFALDRRIANPLGGQDDQVGGRDRVHAKIGQGA